MLSLRVALLLSLAVLAAASFEERAYRTPSNSTLPNVHAPGRRIPMKLATIETADGRTRVVRRNPCKQFAGLSVADARACKAQMLVMGKHEAIQARLAKMQARSTAAPTPKPTLPPTTGYLVNAQWDGRTFPDVEWALDITRQNTVIYYPFEPQELQLQLLIPTRSGPADAPTFSSYNPLTREYFLIVDHNAYGARMWGVTVAGDVSNVSATYPFVPFKFPAAHATMVGLETALVGGVFLNLVFYADGTVQQVDPTTGAGKPFSNICGPGRQANAVTYREGTNDIFVLTQSPNIQEPKYGVVTFNVATRQSNEVLIGSVPYFDPTAESGFEMVWAESLQNLVVMWTGAFDQIMYVQPFTGVASFAVFNMHDYSGGFGALEFTVSTYLEDLDTTANAAIDTVAQQIYFQCSQVDENDDVTTSLCAHPVQPDYPGLKQGSWDYINVNIAPMTYGYAAAEYVQIEK